MVHKYWVTLRIEILVNFYSILVNYGQNQEIFQEKCNFLEEISWSLISCFLVFYQEMCNSIEYWFLLTLFDHLLTFTDTFWYWLTLFWHSDHLLTFTDTLWPFTDTYRHWLTLTDTLWPLTAIYLTLTDTLWPLTNITDSHWYLLTLSDL